MDGQSINSFLTYSSVVSGGPVFDALNNLKIPGCDFQNAYLTANCREKIYMIAGAEFGSEVGCVMIIRKALYELKSFGAVFRAHLANTISKADPNI